MSADDRSRLHHLPWLARETCRNMADAAERTYAEADRLFELARRSKHSIWRSRELLARLNTTLPRLDD